MVNLAFNILAIVASLYSIIIYPIGLTLFILDFVWSKIKTFNN